MRTRKTRTRNSFHAVCISQVFLFLFHNFIGARYFDRGVFSEGNGLDTPLGHPSLPRAPFGFGFKSAQEVSDIVFNINNTDNGNNRRVSHLYMTFGQFMDHDFAYILHPSSSSSGCRARYLFSFANEGAAFQKQPS